jgi:hypothetical protein
VEYNGANKIRGRINGEIVDNNKNAAQKSQANVSINECSSSDMGR